MTRNGPAAFDSKTDDRHSRWIRVVALLTAMVFFWNQIVFASDVNPFDQRQTVAVQATLDAESKSNASVSLPANDSAAAPTNSIDFLLSSNSPLGRSASIPQAVSDVAPLPPVMNDAPETPGWLEITNDGKKIYHVRNEIILQGTIDHAEVGDTVLLEPGTYHGHFTLKQGVNLKGGDPATTILSGDFVAGQDVLQALGDNLIEGITITESGPNGSASSSAISIQGDHVKIRGNVITRNLGSGVFVAADVSDVLIEQNTFFGNSTAVKGARDGNVIRYNTITGPESVSSPQITGINYVPNRGFQLSIARSENIYSYFIEYTDDGGINWKRAQVELSPGVLTDLKLLSNPAGITTWVDDGSSTSPNPFDVASRWYRVVTVESFNAKTGIEIPTGEAPAIQNNIITNQTVQSIWDTSPSGSLAQVEGNVFFHNAETGSAQGSHLPIAIVNRNGTGWTGGNTLVNPQFLNLATRDFHIPTNSPAYGKGAILPAALKAALDRASAFDVANTLQPILQGSVVTGYQILYSEGSHEEFYNDGRRTLDTIAPVINFLSIPSLTNHFAFQFHYTLDGVDKTATRNLSEGLNTVTLEDSDIFGNRTTRNFTITLDSIGPAVSLESSLSTANASYQLIYKVDGATRTENLSLVSGANVISRTFSDAAGNETSVSFQITVTGRLPVVSFTSASLVTSSSYDLVYQVNGVSKTTHYTLKEGANLLTVEESGAGGKTVSNYLVILNALPSVNLPSSDMSLNLNLDGTAVTLLSPTFSVSGTLEGGWIKGSEGNFYHLENGSLSEEIKADGTRIFYDSHGRVHSKITADLKITDFSYETDSVGSILRTIAREGNAFVVLSPSGAIMQYHNANGSDFYFSEGKLIRVEAGGVTYTYSVSVTASGFRSQIVSPVLSSSSEMPQSILYDSSNRMIQMTKADGTVFDFNAAGAVTRVRDASGVETTYTEDMDASGLISGITVTRDGLIRKYDETGALTEITQTDGTVFGISGNRIASIKQADNTLYDHLTYNASGVLQNAQVHMTDGRTLFFEAQHLVKMTLSDETIIEFQSDKPTFSRMKDGRVYQYTGQCDSAVASTCVSKLIEFRNEAGNRVLITNSLVSGIEELDGATRILTSYTYDAQNRISQATITRDGTVVGRFDYQYGASDTRVTNQLNSIRYYDANGRLTKLVTAQGEEYAYTSTVDAQGHSRILQTLVKIVSQLNGTADYVDGKPVTITRPDNIRISNIVLGSGNSFSAGITYPSGATGIIENGYLKRVTESNGTIKLYSNGLLERVTTSTLVVTNFNYTKDGSGNVLSITVEDSLGRRTYTATGVISSAQKPDGTLLTYDASGNLQSVRTPAGEEFLYSGGSLFRINFLSTGESLTGITLDASNNLVNGTFNASDGSVQTITSGYLSQIRTADNTVINYLSSGKVSSVITSAGDRIDYSGSGTNPVIKITRANGAYISNITTDSQDALITSGFHMGDSFSGSVASNGTVMSGYSLINGIAKKPGAVITSAYHAILLATNIPGASPSSGDSIAGNCSSSCMGAGFELNPKNELSNAAYIKVRLSLSGGPFRMELYGSNGTSLLYSQTFASGSVFNGDVYFEIPAGLGAIGKFKLVSTTNNRVCMSASNLAFYTRADFTPTGWPNLAVSYVSMKTAPALSTAIGVALQKKTSLEAVSATFKAATAANATSVSENVYSASAIRSSVSQFTLPGSAVVTATYDTSMNLISATHSNSSFNEASDPNGAWRIPVSGWEDTGYSFAPSASTPEDGTALQISYKGDGSVNQVTLQGNRAVSYQNGQVQQVITPGQGTIHYTYATATGNSSLSTILIDATASDAATEIVYEYDKIRGIKKNGILVYRYLYEYTDLGSEIVVIEDINAKEERRFLGDKLLSVRGLSTGFITSYTYDDSGRISQAETERSGRVFAKYTYTYETTNTVIQDDSGTIRLYDSDGNLKRLTTSTGQIYHYSTLSDGQGEDLILQQLTQVSTALKGTIDYLQGVPTKIVTPDGIQITDIVLNSDNSIKQAIIKFPEPDGRIAVIQDGQVVHVASDAEGVQLFEGGFLERYLDGSGNLTVITYTKDASGAIASISVADKDSTRVYTKDGVLTKATLPDQTQIDYENGKIKRITCPSVDSYNYENGVISSIVFGSSQGKIEQVVLNPDGTLKSGIYTKDGVILTIQDGIVTRKQNPDGTIYNYLANGKASSIITPAGDRIDYSGIGTDPVIKITRADGSYVTGLTLDSQEALLGGSFYLGDHSSGSVASGTSVISGYPLLNGIIKRPGTQITGATSIINRVGPGTGTPTYGDSITGDCSSSCIGAGFEVYPTGALSNASYIRVRVSLTGGPFQMELYGTDKSTLLSTQAFAAGSVFSGYVYFEVPAGTGAIGKFRIVSTTNSSVHIEASNLGFFNRADFSPTGWTNIAVPYFNQKTAPLAPSVIAEKLLLKPGLETNVARQLTLATPTQVDLGAAQTVYAAAQNLVTSNLLDKNTIIASAYRKLDGEILMAASADKTVAHYANGNVDKVTDLDGNLLIDYEYNATNDLIHVYLYDSRNQLIAQNLEAQNQIAEQKEEALLQLAIAKGKAVEGIAQMLAEALANIAAQRQALIEQSEQKVCRTVLFWRQCTTVHVDISAGLAQLDQMERDAREGASSQLALLDTEVATQKQKIEEDTVTALVKLEEQRLVTYQELVKQELRPVICNYYRKILGRDPNQSETNAWLALYLATERVDGTRVTNDLTSSAEHAARLQMVSQIKTSVRDFLINEYLPANQMGRNSKLAALGLLPADAVTLTLAEVDVILSWIDSRDLHFGHSAFYAIQELLHDNGTDVSLFDIARESILIDILSGIIHPLTSGDLELSLFSLQTVAKIHNPNMNFTAAQIDFEELKRELSIGWTQAPGAGKGILVHINGNHYVVVTNVEFVQKTDEAGKLVFDEEGNAVMVEMVTYQEKNVGPNGEAIRISKEEFMKLWMVNGKQEGVVLTPIAVSPQSRVLTAEETKQIRGAFFIALIGLIIGFIIGAIGAAIAVAVAVVTAIITAMVTFVANVVLAIAQAVLMVGKGLIFLAEHFFAGVKFVSDALLRGLSSGFSFLKDGLASFGKFLTFPGGAQFSSGSLTTAQLVARQVIGVAVCLGSGTILDKLGVNPMLANLTTAFITGGVVGFVGGVFGAGTTFINSGLQMLAISGVNELALHIGLPPPISNILSLVAGTLAGTITNPSQLPTALQTLVPQITQELVITGITELGNLMGIDPRISQLAGMTASSLFNSVANMDGNPGSWGSVVFNAVIQGLLKGAASISIEALGELAGLNALWTSLIARAVTGALEGFITSGSSGIFSGIYQAYVDSTLRFLTFGGPGGGIVNEALFLTKTLDFADIVKTQGLGTALSVYISGIFHRDSVESLYRSAVLLGKSLKDYLDDRLRENKRRVFQMDGKTYQALTLDANGNIELIYDASGKLIGIKEANRIILSDDIRIDPDTRQVYMRNAKIFETRADGTRTVSTVSGGALTAVIVYDKNKNIIAKFEALPGSYGLVFAADGKLIAGRVEYPQRGMTLTFENGNIKNFETTGNVDVKELEKTQLLYNMLPDFVKGQANLIFYTNGVDNPYGENQPPNSAVNLRDSLSRVSAVMVPVFESGFPMMGNIPILGDATQIMRDSLNWLYNTLRLDDLVNLATNLVKSTSNALFTALGLDQIFPNRNIVSMTVDLAKAVLAKFGINDLSGEIQEKMEDYLTAHPLAPGQTFSVVAYSGSGNSMLELIQREDYPVDTIIFLGSPTLQGSLTHETIDNPYVRRVINIYGENDPIPYFGGSKDKSFNGIETINIRIMGTDHFDYFPGAGGVALSGADNFVKQLLIASRIDESELNNLLSKLTMENGVYVVDPTKFKP